MKGTPKLNYMLSVSYSSISVTMWILRGKYHQKCTKLDVSQFAIIAELISLKSK